MFLTRDAVGLVVVTDRHKVAKGAYIIIDDFEPEITLASHKQL